VHAEKTHQGSQQAHHPPLHSPVHAPDLHPVHAAKTHPGLTAGTPSPLSTHLCTLWICTPCTLKDTPRAHSRHTIPPLHSPVHALDLHPVHAEKTHQGSQQAHHPPSPLTCARSRICTPCTLKRHTRAHSRHTIPPLHSPVHAPDLHPVHAERHTQGSQQAHHPPSPLTCARSGSAPRAR